MAFTHDGAVKEPIDNPLRFRYLFLGLVVIFMSSSYGTYALFGLYLKVLYGFDFKAVIDVFVIGTSAGLGFAALAGLVFDYVGHRITIGYATVLCFVASLCMGLGFDGHFDITEPKMDGLFFLMNAGGHSMDLVATLVTVTHFPRNRGMVCGLYKALGGLGASIFSALFRGYLNSSLPNMYYLFAAVTGTFGVVSLILYVPAPYVNFRFHRAVRMLRAKAVEVVPVDQLHEIRERMSEYFNLKVPFMKYQLPRRRVRLVFFILFVLNVFLATQILLVAYKNITSRVVLNIFSTVALVLLLLLTVLVWPCDCLDEKVDYSKDSMDIDRRGQPIVPAPAERNPLVGGDSRHGSVTSVETFLGVTRGVFNQSVEEGSDSVQNEEVEELGLVDKRTVENMDRVVSDEVNRLTPDNRLALNYDSVTELLKHRDGWQHAMMTPEFWILVWLSFIVWSTGMIMTNNLFIQIYYTAIDKQAMDNNLYYLYSAVTGIIIGSGRMAIGMIADDIMPSMRVWLKIPFRLPFTLLLVVAPWLIVVGLLLHLAVPDTKGLMAGYVFISLGYGLVTSTVPYAVTCFFSFEHVGLGKIYGVCLLAVGLGVSAFYRGLFFELYNKKAFPMDFPLPQARGVCLAGKKDCAQTFLLVLFFLNLTAGVLAVVLHIRYQRKINAMAKKLIDMLQLSISTTC